MLAFVFNISVFVYLEMDVFFVYLSMVGPISPPSVAVWLMTILPFIGDVDQKASSPDETFPIEA